MNNSAAFNACLLANAAGFYQWLNSASPGGEIAEAVVKTIEEHPELGINKEDVLMKVTYPDVTPVREGETVELNVDNQTVYVTANEVYPNGVRISISGPPEWRAATAPGMVVSSVEVPDTVHPGDTVTVKVHLRNEGAQKVRYLNVFVTPTPMGFNDSSSIASAVSMALSQSGMSKSVFYPEGGSAVQYIEYLEGKENATLTFRIKINPDADVGTYPPLYVGVAYFTGLGSTMRMMQGYNFVALTVKKPRAAFVEITGVDTSPREISPPGDTFTVRFTIENTGGEEPARAIGLKIESYKVPVQGGEVKNVDLAALSGLPVQGGSEQLSQSLQDALNRIMVELAKQNVEAFLPVGEDNVKYVAELGPGGEKTTLEFRVKANDRLENGGVYPPLRIGLDYLTEPNGGEEITDERLVGIDVTGRAKLILSRVSTSPNRILPRNRQRGGGLPGGQRRHGGDCRNGCGQAHAGMALLLQPEQRAGYRPGGESGGEGRLGEGGILQDKRRRQRQLRNLRDTPARDVHQRPRGGGEEHHPHGSGHDRCEARYRGRGGGSPQSRAHSGGERQRLRRAEEHRRREGHERAHRRRRKGGSASAWTRERTTWATWSRARPAKV